jgi:hypothetical protein
MFEVGQILIQVANTGGTTQDAMELHRDPRHIFISQFSAGMLHFTEQSIQLMNRLATGAPRRDTLERLAHHVQLDDVVARHRRD